MTQGVATDEAARLRQLAGISGALSPVVSVYLNIRWADEHQRERVRLFLASELRKARAAGIDPGLASDLDWIEAQGRALVEQHLAPDAGGVALFACHALGLRETLPVRTSFEQAFVVDQAAYLTPLAALLEADPTGLVVFVDSEHARLIPLGPGGLGEEVELRGEVPGHHRRGGWALLAQSRYQRHIQVHRDQHLEAVAEALGRLVETGGARQVVLAGDARLVAALRAQLPPSLAGRVAGVVPAARYEPASALVSRAAALLAGARATEVQAAVDAVLTEAAKGAARSRGPRRRSRQPAAGRSTASTPSGRSARRARAAARAPGSSAARPPAVGCAAGRPGRWSCGTRWWTGCWAPAARSRSSRLTRGSAGWGASPRASATRSEGRGGMREASPRIAKAPRDWWVAANLLDYEAARATFSWAAARRELTATLRRGDAARRHHGHRPKRREDGEPPDEPGPPGQATDARIVARFRRHALIAPSLGTAHRERFPRVPPAIRLGVNRRSIGKPRSRSRECREG